jgi:hypothetical protein
MLFVPNKKNKMKNYKADTCLQSGGFQNFMQQGIMAMIIGVSLE